MKLWPNRQLRTIRTSVSASTLYLSSHTRLLSASCHPAALPALPSCAAQMLKAPGVCIRSSSIFSACTA